MVLDTALAWAEEILDAQVQVVCRTPNGFCTTTSPALGLIMWLYVCPANGDLRIVIEDQQS